MWYRLLFHQVKMPTPFYTILVLFPQYGDFLFYLFLPADTKAYIVTAVVKNQKRNKRKTTTDRQSNGILNNVINPYIQKPNSNGIEIKGNIDSIRSATAISQLTSIGSGSINTGITVARAPIQ